MFIKETQTYKELKKNVKGLFPLKASVFIAELLISLAATYTMVFIQRMIDTVTNISENINLEVFYSTLFFTIGIVLAYMLLTYVNKILNFHLELKSQRQLTKYLFKSFYKQEFLFPTKHEAGDVSTKLQKYAGTVSFWIATGELTFWKEITGFLIVFVILWSYLPSVAIIVIVVMTTCFVLTKKINEKIAFYDNNIFETVGDITQFFIQAHKSFVDVKQLKKEQLQVDEYLNIFDGPFFKNSKLAIYWETFYESIFNIVLYLMPVLVLIYGVYMTLQGDFTIGKTIAVYTLITMLQDPLNAIASNISECKKNMVLSEGLQDFIPLPSNQENETETFEKFRNLTFDCKSFAYDDKKELLKDFKFEINRGDFICIKGHTGSGKSTIVSLIMRFNKLEAGTIKINDKDINKYKYDDFYNNVNILGQVPFVFHDTVENNIKFGDNYSQENFDEVIEVAQLEEFVREYGKNHVLNEDANNISGGQKQRISLARFLIRKPQILILDEPTAALDKITAHNFAKALKEFAKKYEITLIVISHNPEFDNVATKIISL